MITQVALSKSLSLPLLLNFSALIWLFRCPVRSLRLPSSLPLGVCGYWLHGERERETVPAAQNLMASVISPLNRAVSLAHRATFGEHTPTPLCIIISMFSSTRVFLQSIIHALFVALVQTLVTQMDECEEIKMNKRTWNTRWQKPRSKKNQKEEKKKNTCRIRQKAKKKKQRSETKADKSVNDNTRKEERQNTSIKKNVV